MRPVPFLLPQPTSPRLLRGTPASLCPRSLSTLPAGGAGGEAGGSGHLRALGSRSPGLRHLCGPAAPSAPVLQAAPAAARSVTTRAGMCPQASRGVSVPRLAAGFSLPPCPSATLLLARAEAASGCPSTASLHPASCSRSLPGSLWGRPFCLGVLCAPPPSRMACDAAGPSGHLGHVCEFVAPLPAAAWGLLLSVHCPAFSISVSPPPRGGWSPALLWI